MLEWEREAIKRAKGMERIKKELLGSLDSNIVSASDVLEAIKKAADKHILNIRLAN